MDVQVWTLNKGGNMKNGIIIILTIACIALAILGITGQFRLIDEKEELQKFNSLLIEYIKIIPLTNIEKRIEIGKKQLELSKELASIQLESIEIMEKNPYNLLSDADKNQLGILALKQYELNNKILELSNQKLKLYED